MFRIIGAAIVAVALSWSNLANASAGPFDVASFTAIGTAPNVEWKRDPTTPGWWHGGTYTSLETATANVNFRFLSNPPSYLSEKYIEGLNDLAALGDLPAIMKVASTKTYLGQMPYTNGFTSNVGISFYYAGASPLVVGGQTYAPGTLLLGTGGLLHQGAFAGGFYSSVFDFSGWAAHMSGGSLGIEGEGPVVTVNGVETYADYVGRFANGSFYGAIPEPAIWAMMIVGFGLAGVGIRRNRPALGLA